jgi:hypothetical protein
MAQRAQVVKSSQPITCDSKKYQLRVLMAEVPESARALGIVLTPEDSTDSRVFCLYWINPKSPSPTHRDDTKGVLGSHLIEYGNGTIQGAPVVESFFTESKCSAEDPQVNSIQAVLANSTSATSLRDVAGELRKRNVDVDADQIEDASAGSLDLFRGLQNEIGFARAIRLYVSSVLGADGRIADQAGSKPSWESEKATLSNRIKTLEGQVQDFKKEKDSFLGGAPTWVAVSFPTTLILLLAALAFIGLAFRDAAKKGAKGSERKGSNGGLTQNSDNSEADSLAAAQISGRLGLIIAASLTRRRGIEEGGTKTDQTGAGRNQKAIATDRLTNTIMLRLDKCIPQKHYPTVRRVMTEVLTAERDTTKNEWYGAFAELQNQLEELQNSLSGPNGETAPSTPRIPYAPGTAEAGAVVTELTGKLNQLITDMGAMKSTVSGFDGKLTKHFEASRALQIIGERWYDQTYSGEQTDALVREVGEAIDLYYDLSGQWGKAGVSVAQMKACLLMTLDSLKGIRETYLNNLLDHTAQPDAIAAGVKIKLSQDAEAVKEYKAIDTLLRPHLSPGRTPYELVTHMISELSAVQKLRRYHPDRNLSKTIDAVVANYEAVEREVRQILPNLSGTVQELVSSLAQEYQKVRTDAGTAKLLQLERDDFKGQLSTAQSQLKAGKELAGEIAQQLNYRTDDLTEDAQAITSALDQLRKERDASVYLQVRLGLSSALIALEKATSTNGSEEQRDVIAALLIDKVRIGIKGLLGDMKDYSGDQLWNRGIFTGFSQKWLHDLIRADLLLRTYYTHRKEFGLLRRAVSLACSTLIAALYEFQVEVAELELFEELPRDMETEPVYATLRNLPAVQEKVRSKIQNLQTRDVVVDITSFPYFVKGEKENGGRASIANPSAWLQH